MCSHYLLLCGPDFDILADTECLLFEFRWNIGNCDSDFGLFYLIAVVGSPDNVVSERPNCLAGGDRDSPRLFFPRNLRSVQRHEWTCNRISRPSRGMLPVCSNWRSVARSFYAAVRTRSAV
jgi:hypothetical protein